LAAPLTSTTILSTTEFTMRFAIALLLLSCTLAHSADDPTKNLMKYVEAPDKSYAWKLVNKSETNGNAIYTLSMTSQTWQGNEWKHDLQVFVPKNSKPQSTMVLWNTGGKAGTGDSILGLAISGKVGAPVAFLFGVPLQPLYDGKKEDALIAHTFVKYLETKDPSWPLLFPMTKSVIRGMDALQAFAKAEWKFDVTQFVITGASKRGWTSWLTAATEDKRVKAIAPLVIDTLNFPTQMKNQLAAFGKPSEMIADYTRAKLVPIPETTEGESLWKMVDPYSYLDRITVPKMIINGTNDPYWPQDALNTYWGNLKGEKHLCYIPNAGHDLREMDKDGKKSLLPVRALNTLAAFSRSQIFEEPMPKLTWKWDAQKLKYDVEANGTIVKCRTLACDSNSRDFRKSYWKVLSESQPKDEGKGYNRQEDFAQPEKGYRAVMVEVEFLSGASPLTLTTQIQILEAKK